jgi:hypothetical protein
VRRGALAALAAVVLVVAAARTAEARWLDLRVGLRAGGMTGWGGDSTTPDFFKNTRGPAAGFELGVRLLILDVSANFLQVFDSHGREGTLTQVLAGVAYDFGVGNEKLQNGKRKNYIRLGTMGGVGLGTAGPVHPPLTNDQVSDKGIVSQTQIGYEHYVDSILAIGLEGDIGYHYFLGGQVINASQDHSAGPDLIGMATLTLHLGF